MYPHRIRLRGPWQCEPVASSAGKPLPAAGRVKGYFVMMRETTSPVWQKKIWVVGNEINLPYSKDNYFFAVQSVSETGNEGLPVVPTPGR